MDPAAPILWQAVVVGDGQVKAAAAAAAGATVVAVVVVNFLSPLGSSANCGFYGDRDDQVNRNPKKNPLHRA